MSEKIDLKEQFKDMDYETAINKLKENIRILEKGEGTLDELMQVYKESFLYYHFCYDYLQQAKTKIEDFNQKMAEIISAIEEK
ncbi:MAG: exodeoxyribonuclease VII small subunit [Ruminococcus sp.]|nr:exodeoxyribonuclease VII small subunit [Ruminococcus sp.]